MEKVKLGKTNHMLSKIGLGTVQFGLNYGFTKKKSQEKVNEILSCAVNNGINFIDTAREYGDSEEKIGRFISENSNSFIVATKLEKIPCEVRLDEISIKDKIYSSVENSLKNLKLTKISMLQLHQTDSQLINNIYFWETIERLKTEKLIESFGVSVYEEIETSFLIDNYHSLIDFFQIPYNIFDRRFDDLKKQLFKYSIGVISRSTYLKGIIPCSLSELPSYLEELVEYKIRLSNIANKISLKAEELALLFVYQSELIGSTILGVDSSEELIKNISLIKNYKSKVLNISDLNELIVKDLKLIDPRKWSNF